MKFAKDKIYKNKNKHMSNKELKDKFKKYGKIPTKVGKCFTEQVENCVRSSNYVVSNFFSLYIIVWCLLGSRQIRYKRK